MDSHDKALACAKAVIDKMGENVRILDLSDRSSFTDYFVICSSRSDRQAKAMADSVETLIRASGAPILSLEGYAEGRWVLIDLGDVIVHIFQDELRDFYDLESLWSDARKVQIPAEVYQTSDASHAGALH